MRFSGRSSPATYCARTGFRPMGTFRHALTLFAPSGDRAETVDAMVDSGSTFTWISAPVLDRLGVRPDRERNFVMADGRRMRRGMAEVRVELNGEQIMTLVVFAPTESPPLLGAYTLEGFSLAVDVTNKRLIPAENYALRVARITVIREYYNGG